MIVQRDVLKELLTVCRKKQIIGLAGGAFDMFHAGHVDLLRKARKMVDILIVAVNSDASVKDYKAPDRPIIPEQDRITIVDSCKYVDFCFLFDEPNQFTNLSIIQPDVFIKGGDYSVEKLKRIDQIDMLEHQPKIVIVPRESEVSTTGIIARIRRES